MAKVSRSPRYALVSVFDKTGVVAFAKQLQSAGYQIISTGGTAKELLAHGIAVVPIQSITGNPESFDGRMKTISFQIESGILFDRSNPKHVKEAHQLQIPYIDVVVCNLYPFEQKQTIENIDVGGPTMIRAAAKNHTHVLVLTTPEDYQRVGQFLEKKDVSLQVRKELAAKAFRHLSYYDSQIGKYLQNDQKPSEMTIAGKKSFKLRYGENPHQTPSAVYFEPQAQSPMVTLQKRIGRDLSYVNFTDIAAGIETVRMFKESSAVIIKHNSPCGIALGKNPLEALKRAIDADPQSAFGGVAVLNRAIDEKTAHAFKQFKKRNVQMDIVAAPDLSVKAEAIIHSVRATTGIYTFGNIPKKRKNTTHIKFFDGGFITQPWDDWDDSLAKKWQCVTKKKPTKKQLGQMIVAWKFLMRIRSNTILILDKKIPMTRGIGSGQTARILSAKIALDQAGKHAQGAILASDSFFPFGDTVTLAASHGVRAIVQQGGSVRDRESIELADKAGIVMMCTGRRAFWH